MLNPGNNLLLKMNPMNPLKIAAIGCGPRTRTYCTLAAKYPDRYCVVAAADPDAARVKSVAAVSGNPDFQCFHDDKEILAQPQLADVMIIGTQDAEHAGHAIAAMERGYHLLLEKPIAPNPSDIQRIYDVAVRLDRRVTVCHVLRYTPFYGKLRQLLQEGWIGQLITLNAVEGVEPFRQAHSFVRGHWSNTKTSSPMILAKSCHDLDIIRWLVDAPCQRISSFGSNTWFHSGNKPEGAPLRCTDGCPVENECFYNAKRYFGEEREKLNFIMSGMENTTRQQQEDWLKSSPWSRCVYQCDNDTVDHQTVNMEFANSVTATFTMTAFDHGRNIEVYGTKGRIKGGDFLHRLTGSWFHFESHDGRRETFDIEIPEGGYDGHLGGDGGMMNRLFDEMTGPKDAMTSPLGVSLESHFMAFAAERARLAGQVVRLD